MKRRCKVGDRARILTGSDRGMVVLVVRKYHGEVLGSGEGPWVEKGFFSWVVASLAAPLQRVDSRTKAPMPAKMMAVYDDTQLEPLQDDDPAEDESTDTEKPRSLEKLQ